MSDTANVIGGQTTALAAPRQRLSLADAAAQLGGMGQQGAPRPTMRQPGATPAAELSPQDNARATLDAELDGTIPEGNPDQGPAQPSESEATDEPKPFDQAAFDALPDDTVLYRDEDGADVTKGELRARGLRQADYSRKMAHVAQLRGAAEQDWQTARQERQLVAELVTSLYPRPDPALLHQDRDKYYAMLDAHMQGTAFVQQLWQRQAQEQAQRETASKQQLQTLVLELIPEWLDPAVRNKELALGNSYLQREGYPEHIINRIGQDPWLIKLALAASKHGLVKEGARKGGQASAQARQVPTTFGGQSTAGQTAAQRQTAANGQDVRDVLRHGRRPDRMARAAEMLAPVGSSARPATVRGRF